MFSQIAHYSQQSRRKGGTQRGPGPSGTQIRGAAAPSCPSQLQSPVRGAGTGTAAPLCEGWIVRPPKGWMGKISPLLSPTSIQSKGMGSPAPCRPQRHDSRTWGEKFHGEIHPCSLREETERQKLKSGLGASPIF